MPAYSPKRAPTLEWISARLRRATIALVASGVVAVRALGATVYWDTNGSATGTDATPSGTWDTVNSNKVWSTNSGGTSSTSRWTNGDIAVFSAGINGTNAFTVTAASVTAGGIVFEEGQAAISGGTVTLSAGASITATANATIASTLAGTNWTKNGAGTLTLSGSNTYTGALTIASGTLQLGAAGSASSTPLGTSAGSTTVSSGASLDLNGFTLGTAEALSLNGVGAGSVGALTNSNATAATYRGIVTLTGAATIGGTGNITLSHTNGIAGNFLLTKTGTGTLTINSSSGTRTGGAQVNEGTLKLANATALGATSQSITLNGGTLDLATNTSVGAYPVTVTASSTIASDRSTSGSGITHTLGALSINNSTLSLIAGANVSTNSAYGVTFGATTLTGNATLDVANNGSGTGTLTLGSVSETGGARSLTKIGAGAVILSGTNTHTGGTILDAGNLTVNTGASLGASTGALTVNGGTLNLNNTAQSVGTLSGTGGTLNLASGHTLTVTQGSDATFAGTIAGSAAFVKEGASALTLAGNNTYTGATTINAGTLKLGSAGSGANAPLGTTAAGTTVNSGGALDLNGFSLATAEALSLNGSGVGSTGALTNSGAAASFSGAITLSGATTIGGTGNLTLSGAITGANALTKTGTNALTLSGSNSYTGKTSIQNGTLAISTISDIGSGASSLGAPTTIANGTIDLGSGNNTGTLLFTGTLFQSTNRVINLAGTTGGGVIDGSGTGGLAFTSNLTVTGIGAKTLTLTGSNTANAFSGAIVNGSGTTSLTKDGAGTWTLNGAHSNTYTGTTTVNAGTLALAKTGGAVAIAGSLVIGDGAGADTVQLNGANQIAAASAVTFTAGGTPTLNLNGYSQTLASIASTNTNAQLQLGTPAGSSTFTVGDSTSTTFAGVISGGANASFVKQGSGTLTLSGANNLSGPVSVTAGTLALSGASVSLGASTAGTIVSSGATLALQGGASTSNGQLSLSGTGVTNTGALTNVSGTNTWTGNLTLASNTTINSQSGTLNLGSARPPWDIDGHTQPPENGFVTIGGQTLTFTGSGNVVVNSRIRDFVGQTAGTSYLNATTLSYAPETTNPGNVVIDMTGTGAVTFKANANSYTGSTTVQTGTLILNTVSNVGAPHDGTTDSFHALNGPLVIGTGSNTTSATVQLGTGGAANELMSIGTTVTLYRDGLLNLMGNAQTIDALTFTGGTVDAGDGGALYLNNNVTVNASAGNTATITGTGSGMVSMTLNRDVIADTGPDATRTFTVHHGTGNTYDLTISALVKNGNLIKAGDGTMMLNRHNTYIGYTSVTGGILNIQAGSDSNAQSGLGSGDGLTDSQATFVNVNPTTNAATGTQATLQLQGNISLTSEKIYLAGNGYTPSDAAQGAGPLGALNNHSGNNTIGTAATELIKLAADARINSSSGLLTIATNIGSTNNHALTVGGSGNTTISGSINTGEGSTTTVTKDGSGTLILSGLNSYQGATHVTAGVLSVQHNRGLGAVTTGSNGTFVTSGAELQLSNAANGNLSIGGEALTLNGAGIGGTSGALHNVAGNNSFGGLITLGSASTIKSDAGTTLTLSGGTTTAGNNYGLTIAGAGNTTISGGMTNSAGSLTKNDSGTFTFAGTSGSTSGTVGKTHLNAGNMVVGNGTTPTTLNTAEFDSAVGTTLTIASGGTVVANYASGTTYFSGAIASTGTYGSNAIATFQKDGAGTLVFDHSFNAGPNSKLVLNGGTLSLLGAAQITFGTIHITANTVLDFNNIAGTFLSSAQLVIDAGVTVTVNNWISVANNTAQSTVWYATNTVNAGTLGGSDIVGGTPLGQIIFTNYNGLTTTWVAGNHTGWFDHEIRPTPEPATYGAIFLAACFGFVGWRRWRRK